MGPKEGKCLSIMGDTYRILISGKETDGAFSMIDMLIPPGGGPGPHAHTEFQESFFVVDGEIEVKSEAGTYVATKGSFVSIPKGGMIHCFKNKSDKLAHLLCTVVPSGLDEFFEEIGTPVPFGEFLPVPEMTPDLIKFLTMHAEKHGQKIYPPDYLN